MKLPGSLGKHVLNTSRQNALGLAKEDVFLSTKPSEG